MCAWPMVYSYVHKAKSAVAVHMFFGEVILTSF